MKKIIICTCLFAISFATFGQTCEQRQYKLLVSIGSSTTGFLYNAHETVSLYYKSLYGETMDATDVDGMLDVQATITSAVRKNMQALLDEKALVDQDDKDFAADLIKVMDAIIVEIKYLRDCTSDITSKDKKQKFLDKKNATWTILSKAMGMDDKK